MFSYVPKKIAQYASTTTTEKAGFVYSHCQIKCTCGNDAFQVSHTGSDQSKCIQQKAGQPLVVKAACMSCGAVIPLYYSEADGYDNEIDPIKQDVDVRFLNYMKCLCRCSCATFNVSVKYEYPCGDELNELEIADGDNAFLWIWLDISCCSCKKKRQLLSMETG